MDSGLKLHDFRQRYRESVLFQRLANGAFWSLIAALGTNFGNLFSGIILANILGKFTYGQYGMLRTTLNMFIVFSSFSLGATATKYIAEYRVKDKEKTGRIIGLSLIAVSLLSISFFLVCYFNANMLAIKSLNSADMGPKLKIGAWMILFAVLNSVLTGILSGFESFSCIAKVNISGMIILIASSIIGAKFWELNGALVALSIYLAGMVLISLYFLYKELKFYDIPVSYKNCFRELPLLWNFSLPTTLSGLLATPVLWIGSTMLVKSPAGYDGMAGFDVVNQWKMAVLFIPNIIARTSLPILSNLNRKEQKQNYFKVLKFMFVIDVITAILVATLLSTASPYILKLYGEKFAEYIFPFIIMMVGAVFYSANTIIGQVILSRGLAWIGCLMNIIWAMIFLVTTYHFVSCRNLGVTGITLAFLISYICHTVMQYLFMCLHFQKEHFSL